MVTTDDLIEPQGELNAALLFPDLTATQVEDNLQIWMDRATAELATVGVTDLDSIDRGVLSYTYYRAYKSIHQRLSASPSSQSLADAGLSKSIGQGQINEFKIKYLDFERKWVQVLESVTTTDVTLPITQAVSTQISW